MRENEIVSRTSTREWAFVEVVQSSADLHGLAFTEFEEQLSKIQGAYN